MKKGCTVSIQTCSKMKFQFAHLSEKTRLCRLSSYPGGEKNNRRAMFGASGGGGTTYGSPAAPQEISRMYSTDNFREAGSPTRLEPACSTRTVALLMDSRRKDAQKDRSLAGRSSPVSNAHRKFVSKFSMGGGVQYV